MTDHANIDHTGLTGVGASAAADVSITDSGGYFTGTDVEAALQELGGGGGGGGGGITQAYVGYNTVGGSSFQGAGSRTYLKKITLANDCQLSTVEVYCQQNGTGFNGSSFDAAVWSDNAGKPKTLLTLPQSPARPFVPDRVSGTQGDARWLAASMGLWLPAGDYWIGFHIEIQNQILIFYDAGSDYYFDAGGNTFTADAPDTTGTTYTLATESRKYSIRASTIR